MLRGLTKVDARKKNVVRSWKKRKKKHFRAFPFKDNAQENIVFSMKLIECTVYLKDGSYVRLPCVNMNKE